MKPLSLIVAMIGCLVVSPVMADDIQSRDFAYGYMIEAEEGGAVYSLPLPEQVYRVGRRADLGDIRVYNGAGERVPHALKTIKTPEETSRDRWELPLFPLHEGKPDGQESVSLSVKRETDGTLIAIETGGERDADGLPRSGYLLDLGERSSRISTLEIYWQTAQKHAQITLNVLHSSDLQRWKNLGNRTTLVDLEYGGNRVEQRRIELAWQPARYLKLEWPKGQDGPVIDRVVALSRPVASKVQRQYLSLYNGRKTRVDDQLALTFSSNYRVPVSSVNLQFPQTNSIVSGAIQSRDDEEDRWRERCRAVFYNLDLGGEQLQGEPCTFGPTSDSQWRLVILDDGAGLTETSSSLMLSLGWQSDELLFLARGSGPFLLAYGSGKLETIETNGHSEMVLTTVGLQGDSLVKPARLGKKIELGGEEALKTPEPPTPWKTWLLWGVLVAGVIGMALMAMRLVRDMRAGEGEHQKDQKDRGYPRS